MLRTTIAVGASLLVVSTAEAQWTSSRPDGHAPIGVMGDHRHEAGEVMLSYRYMYMSMQGSRVGTDAISNGDIISPTGSNFMVTPTEMPMQMHMVGVMFAPADVVTLVAMGNFVDISMDHVTRAGGAFTTTSSAIGDTKVGGLVRLADFGDQALHLNAMFSIPTGDIERTDVLPTSGGNAVQIPYPMQTGSGTFDLEPGITYLGQKANISWGGQARGVIRIGDNSRDYTLGNRYEGTFWGAYRLSDNFSGSLRLIGSRVENIDGADPAPSVNPAVVPTARTDLRAGTRFDLGLGVNFYVPHAKGLRFAIEGLLPLYQNLNGPQLETDFQIMAGFQIVPVSTH